ncbi:hypothetical protein RIR_jg2627.t1 [Rhizophagus irregularis DAOM 181602=DAOM 197198]|uniref:Uncharacterized protein n=1 Tax=Rhizophagus irregularis (strain DAOM 181602 / DAOM 197198 / MUCL 43194) TaxID=747089 RepID=U9SK21_RHIID|nr:hypothetical protein RIR_jg2627.t1 [Rhizophagus irregularis DAOM 181602=DAOM 197198]
MSLHMIINVTSFLFPSHYHEYVTTLIMKFRNISRSMCQEKDSIISPIITNIGVIQQTMINAREGLDNQDNIPTSHYSRLDYVKAVFLKWTCTFPRIIYYHYVVRDNIFLLGE